MTDDLDRGERTIQIVVPPRFGSSGVTVERNDKLLLVDGSSFFLLVDGTSNLLLPGGDPTYLLTA